MAVSLDQVKANSARYKLLDDHVRFLKGFFADTLPGSVGPLAILRVDADPYQSAMDVLDRLYPKLSRGGYAIFDDYSNLPHCQAGIDEYRKRHGIHDPIKAIDRNAGYWQKS